MNKRSGFDDTDILAAIIIIGIGWVLIEPLAKQFPGLLLPLILLWLIFASAVYIFFLKRIWGRK
jgi:hypothetical protein